MHLQISRLIPAFLLISCVGQSLSIEIDVDLRLDKTNWVDLTDPLSNLPPLGNSINLEQKTHAQSDSELKKENERLRNEVEMLRIKKMNSVDSLMKHVLRQFINKLNIDIGSNLPVFKKAKVTLSADDLSILRLYLNSAKAVEEFGLREDLRAVLENFLVETDVHSANWLFSLLHSMLPYILMANVAFLVPCAFIFLRSILGTCKFAVFIFLSAFCWSCYATFVRKYHEIIAERLARTDSSFVGGKNPCSPQGLVTEAVDVMLSYVRIKDKSECLKSYEDMLVEPLWQVDPLQVIAEVLSNFFLGALPAIGIHLNRFFNNFFINTPVPLALFKMIFLLAVSLALLYLFYLLLLKSHATTSTERRHQHRIEPKKNATKLPVPSRRNSQADLDAANESADSTASSVRG